MTAKEQLEAKILVSQPEMSSESQPPMPLTAKAFQEPKGREPLAATAPELSAVAVLMQFGYSVQPDSDVEMILEIQAMQARLATGNLSDAENMLMSQAVALQGIFASLSTAAKTALRGKNGIQTMQTMMSLALRAQSGSRATLQALGDLKFPRQATFIKQANVANGHQQVNNGTTNSRTKEKNPTTANELSGPPHELLQDTGTSRPSIAGDPQMATVGKINRTKVRCGQGEGSAKRD